MTHMDSNMDVMYTADLKFSAVVYKELNLKLIGNEYFNINISSTIKGLP